MNDTYDLGHTQNRHGIAGLNIYTYGKRRKFTCSNRHGRNSLFSARYIEEIYFWKWRIRTCKRLANPNLDRSLQFQILLFRIWHMHLFNNTLSLNEKTVNLITMTCFCPYITQIQTVLCITINMYWKYLSKKIIETKNCDCTLVTPRIEESTHRSNTDTTGELVIGCYMIIENS